MANRRRGEVAAILAGRPYTLCLTLDSLAELEAAFGVDDMSRLSERFGAGRLSAVDLVRLLGAGLRGGGHPLSDDEVARLPAACLTEASAALTELLAATFGRPVAGGPAANPTGPQGA